MNLFELIVHFSHGASSNHHRLVFCYLHFISSVIFNLSSYLQINILSVLCVLDIKNRKTKFNHRFSYKYVIYCWENRLDIRTIEPCSKACIIFIFTFCHRNSNSKLFVVTKSICIIFVFIIINEQFMVHMWFWCFFFAKILILF